MGTSVEGKLCTEIGGLSGEAVRTKGTDARKAGLVKCR